MHLASEHRHLVTQDHDLDREVRISATDEADQLQHAAERPVEEREGHGPVCSPCQRQPSKSSSQPVDDILGTHRIPDVVVVGAGASGAALAGRLAAGSNLDILVLEAGPDWRGADAPDALRRPDLSGRFALSDEFAAFRHEGLYACRTAVQPPGPYRQGAGLGGSSNINGMVALRPPLEDFAGWGDGPAWSSQMVLSSFIALEDDEQFGSALYHGRGGPTPITRNEQSRWSALDESFVSAAVDVGLDWHEDQNAPGADGVGPLPGNLRDGARHTANDAYLEPVRDRCPNLRIAGSCTVERVLFDDAGAAWGVHCRAGGEERDIEAGEVVLAAGAINTAAILLRSGVGPADDLAALGIPVVADLPVGQAIQDHPMFGLTVEGWAGSDPARGRGYDVLARASSGRPGAVLAHPVWNLHPTRGPGAALFVFDLFPEARGRLTLATPSAEQAPVVEQRLLSTERDLAAARAALAFGGRILANLVCQVSIGSLRLSPTELCDGLIRTELLLATVGDGKHICATAPMRNRLGVPAVVDESGLVLGLSSLRVADMSVAPTVPGANSYLTALMIGEHLAAMYLTRATQRRWATRPRD